MAAITLRGCGVVAGVVEGEALVCPTSIQGWGGIDPATGVIKEHGHVNRGVSIKGRILVLPGSRGSNGWSCYFGAANVAGAGPLGMVVTRIDSSVGVAAAVMQVATVVDFASNQDPCRLIATGDRVRVDGGSGVVEIVKVAATPGTDARGQEAAEKRSLGPQNALGGAIRRPRSRT
ncbi:MAG TPA: DUF126 domain-containing protein [Thermoleophilia bacterium]|nr:DUF126 domain-containing protein [Thermoleophilia bacterium]